jgi:aspartyl protease family protein
MALRRKETINLKKNGRAFLYLIVWILFFIVLLIGFNLWVNSQRKPSLSVVSHQNGELIIRSDPYHHYSIKGSVNGQDTVFFVDTGASFVAVSPKLAASAKLISRRIVSVKTANGQTKGALTRIKVLKIGPYQLHNIKAVILSDDSADSLLGMSALKYFDFEKKGDHLILRANNHPSEP